MIMTPGLRKFALTAHVTCSVGFLGTVAGFLALAVAGLTSLEAPMVRAAYLAMELTARFVIVPLSFASLLTGLVQSLGTPWGLFRHYWVLAKLVLTVLTIVVLLLQMEGISYMAAVAAETTLTSADLLGLRNSLRTHAAGGLLVSLVLAALSIYKPRGMTPYGWRKQHEQPAMPGDARMPRWVKVSGIMALVVALLLVVVTFTGVGGRHGPGRHMPSGDAGNASAADAAAPAIKMSR